MPTAENAKIEYESGQDIVDMVALTDDGAHKVFASADALWSNRAGYQPDVKPNGLATGGAVTPGTAINTVNVAALTSYLIGVLKSVAKADGETVVRGTAPNVYKKDSITVNAAGSIAIVQGTGGTAFSTVRGAAGGPAYILPGSIEICQVWMSAEAGAVILATEIKQVIGTHCERYDYPTWTVQRFQAPSGVLGLAGITFDAALPLSHSEASPEDAVPKGVYAEYYEPAFAMVPTSSDFVAPETSHSVASVQVYGGTRATPSSSLGQGSFSVYASKDGIDEGINKLKNEELFFRFFQDRLNSTPYKLAQGKLGISTTFPAGGQIMLACTISAEEAAIDVLG